MSRPSGRVGNERLITDFLGRMRFGRSPCTARSVAVRGSSVAACGSFGRVGIRIGGRGGRRFRSRDSGVPDVYVKT